MSSAETNAQSIMSRELGREYKKSYRQVCEYGWNGYTDSYLEETANYSNLKTTAKLDVVLELAESDKPGIEVS